MPKVTGTITINIEREYPGSQDHTITWLWDGGPSAEVSHDFQVAVREFTGLDALYPLEGQDAGRNVLFTRAVVGSFDNVLVVSYTLTGDFVVCRLDTLRGKIEALGWRFAYVRSEFKRFVIRSAWAMGWATILEGHVLDWNCIHLVAGLRRRWLEIGLRRWIRKRRGTFVHEPMTGRDARIEIGSADGGFINISRDVRSIEIDGEAVAVFEDGEFTAEIEEDEGDG